MQHAKTANNCLSADPKPRAEISAKPQHRASAVLGWLGKTVASNTQHEAHIVSNREQEGDKGPG
jgi:hypothetical protein